MKLIRTEKVIIGVALGLWMACAILYLGFGCAGKYAPPLPPMPSDPTQPVFYMHADGGAHGSRD